MYVADVETARAHQLFRNGLEEGIPVVITGCAPHFDPKPFSAEAMQQLARESETAEDKIQVLFPHQASKMTAEDASKSLIRL